MKSRLNRIIRSAAPWVVTATAVAGIFWRHSEFTRLQNRIGRTEAESAQLRDRSQRIEREAAALREALVKAGQAVPPATRPFVERAPPSPASETSELEGLRSALAETRDVVEARTARILQVEEALAKAEEENGRVSTALRERDERLASLDRLVQALQAELKTKEARIAQMEIVNRRVEDRDRMAAAEAERINRLRRDLEEIHRRQETHLLNMLRRFREVTDQYRAVAARSVNDRDGVAPPLDLSRIQTAIASAEDDLRQVQQLGAQAGALARKLN